MTANQVFLRFTVKRNWAGKGFVLLDQFNVISRHDTKREAIQNMKFAIKNILDANKQNLAKV